MRIIVGYVRPAGTPGPDHDTPTGGEGFAILPVAGRCGRQLCLREMPISGVNSTPRPTAVYASDPASPLSFDEPRDRDLVWSIFAEMRKESKNWWRE
jgi:hypothetical protein